MTHSYATHFTVSKHVLTCSRLSILAIGKTWTRLAPHKEIIPLGAPGEFDSHTCYAAPPILHPTDPKTTLLYYSGKRRTITRTLTISLDLFLYITQACCRWRRSAFWRWQGAWPCQLDRTWIRPDRRPRWPHAEHAEWSWLPPHCADRGIWYRAPAPHRDTRQCAAGTGDTIIDHSAS